TFDRVAKTFDEIIDRVAAGQVDLGIANLSKTPKRSQRVRFSNSYLTLKRQILVHRRLEATLVHQDDPFAMLNHPNATIAVTRGTSNVDFVKNEFPLAKLDDNFADDDKVLAALLAGKLHAAMNDEVTVKNWLKVKPEIAIEVRVLTHPEMVDLIGVAVPW